MAESGGNSVHNIDGVKNALDSRVKRDSFTLARNKALESKPAFLTGPTKLPLVMGVEQEALRERLDGTLPAPSVAFFR